MAAVAVVVWCCGGTFVVVVVIMKYVIREMQFRMQIAVIIVNGNESTLRNRLSILRNRRLWQN